MNEAGLEAAPRRRGAGSQSETAHVSKKRRTKAIKELLCVHGVRASVQEQIHINVPFYDFNLVAV